MTKLREAARGRDCMVRLEGCDGGGETTCLAHFRLAGTSGVGMKPNDLQGAWACDRCHSNVDRRDTSLPFEETRLAHAEGVLRTLDALVSEGWSLRK